MGKRGEKIIITLALLLFFVCLLFVIKTTFIRYAGKIVLVVVKELPSACKKYNSMVVALNNEEFEVNISRPECVSRAYEIGEQVELIKHDKFSELVWPRAHPETPLIAISLLCGFLYFQIRSAKKKEGQKKMKTKN